MAKLGKSKVTKGKKPSSTKVIAAKLAPAKKVVKAAAATKTVVVPVKKPVVKAAPHATKAAEPKKVSQKLIETIEKRKQQAGAKPGGKAMFAGKPPGRRGRRPKNAVEYTPEHQEEGSDVFVADSDYEGLEYDTGIR